MKERESEVVNKKTKKKKGKKKIILVIVEVLVLLILIGVFWIATKLTKIKSEDVGEVKKNEDIEKKVEEVLEGYTNIALLGLDNRMNGNYDTGNADTIIIARIDNKTKAVKLVSVYRDTYLQVTQDGTYSKVNSAYARNKSGALGMMETLNRNLDLDINRYVSVDWYALVKTINLLGGLDVEMTDKEAAAVNKYVNGVQKATGYTTTARAVAGSNHIDGVQAVSYARIRKGVGDDFKRTERQREIIKKMLAKMKTAGIGTLTKIMDEVFPDISTNFSYAELLGLAAGVADYDIVDTKGFPEDYGGKSMGKSGSCIIPVSLLTNVQKLHEFLFENEEYTPSVTIQQISNQIIYESGLQPKVEDTAGSEGQ